jgi:molecular chaperone GrpE
MQDTQTEAGSGPAGPEERPGDASSAAQAAAASPAISPEERLLKVEAELESMRDAWLRAKAETENVRKRAQTDVAQAHKFAVENFAQQLLTVRDSLEAALKSSQENVQSLVSGTELTLKQLTAAFERVSLREIDPLGEKFDPHRHQGISAVESDQPANTVVQVLQKGYILSERVLRPALVIISKAKDA